MICNTRRIQTKEEIKFIWQNTIQREKRNEGAKETKKECAKVIIKINNRKNVTWEGYNLHTVVNHIQQDEYVGQSCDPHGIIITIDNLRGRATT